MNGQQGLGEVVGRVARLARYPLRAAAAEPLDEVLIGPAGLLDDRRWVVLDEDDESLSSRDAPWLRDVSVSVVDGELTIDVGDGDLVTRGNAEAALSGVAGATQSGLAVTTVRIASAAGRRAGVEPVHLVSTGAQSAVDAPEGCDPDPRANLVVDLERPGAERDWVGLRIGVGEVVLEVTGTPKRCLGVYAGVVRPGLVRAGDPVVILDEQPPPGERLARSAETA